MGNGRLRQPTLVIALGIVASILGGIGGVADGSASADDPCRRESSSWLPPIFSQPDDENPGSNDERSSEPEQRRDESGAPVTPSDPNGSPPSGDSPTVSMPDSSLLYWVALALAVIGIAIALTRLIGPVFIDRRYDSNAIGDAHAGDRPTHSSFSPQDFWSEAERHADAGNYRQAIRHLYRGLLHTLDRSGLIQYDSGRTNWEYLQQLQARGHDELRSLLQTVTLLFEAAWYGRNPLTAEDYQRARHLAGEIRAGIDT